jgi:hypothetical protein
MEPMAHRQAFTTILILAQLAAGLYQSPAREPTRIPYTTLSCGSAARTGAVQVTRSRGPFPPFSSPGKGVHFIFSTEPAMPSKPYPLALGKQSGPGTTIEVSSQKAFREGISVASEGN